MANHEPRIVWRKSSHSGNGGGQCVELAALNDRIAVRDSKNPELGHLSVRPGQFAALVVGLKDR